MHTRYVTLLIAAVTAVLTTTAMAEEGAAAAPGKNKDAGEVKAEGKGEHRRMTAEQKAEMLKKYDANGDGKLDADERKAAMEARRKIKGDGEGKAKGDGEGKAKGEGRKGRGAGAGEGAAKDKAAE